MITVMITVIIIVIIVIIVIKCLVFTVQGSRFGVYGIVLDILEGQGSGKGRMGEGPKKSQHVMRGKTALVQITRVRSPMLNAHQTAEICAASLPNFLGHMLYTML